MDKDNKPFCEIVKEENGNATVYMDKDAEMIIEAPTDKKLISENISNVIIEIYPPGGLGTPRIVEFQFTDNITLLEQAGA